MIGFVVPISAWYEPTFSEEHGGDKVHQILVAHNIVDSVTSEN